MVNSKYEHGKFESIVNITKINIKYANVLTYDVLEDIINIQSKSK